ncbi:unnamed protein product [Lepeophtheirus salmonis]|uniref:(salmon louse) hypothetical protein n=1 Tax=Lepeophtheirus salmonis TaxID=72036 RepID=A0A7R8CR91_LEPSM|nr:unnamed protein product [Lepeophtheirus salmonis]CAF2903000.1 unnamed protein product [Lepeophtheirus salmonis]
MNEHPVPLILSKSTFVKDDSARTEGNTAIVESLKDTPHQGVDEFHINLSGKYADGNALKNPILFMKQYSSNISMYEKIKTEKEHEKIEGVQVNSSAISHEENLQTDLRALMSGREEGAIESVKSSIVSGAL